MVGRLRDWYLLVGSLAFVALGILFLIRGDDDTAPLATIAVFGACAGVAVHQLRGQRKLERQASDPSLTVAVVGGAPIEVDRRRLVLAMVGLLAFGLFLAATGGPLGEGFVAVSLLVAGFAAVALVALAFGWRRGFALIFTREGIVFESPRLVYEVAWSAIIGVELTTINEQPVITLFVADPHALAASAEVRRGEPARAQARLARDLDRSFEWFGAHLVIAPSTYGVDAVVLLRAIERYVGEPGVRGELVPRRSIAGAALG